MKTLNILNQNRKWSIIIVVTVIIFLFISIREDWEALLLFKWDVKWHNILLAALMHVLALGSMFLGWYSLMSKLTSEKSFQINFRIYAISILARRIPLPVWYLGSRVLLYRDQRIPGRIVVTASVLEISLITLTGLICYFILLPWYSYAQHRLWGIPLALGLMMSLTFITNPNLLIKMINWVLKQRNRPVIAVVISRKDLIGWSLLFLATWFLDGFGLYFMVNAFVPLSEQSVNIISISTLSALVSIVTLLLPGGFGLKEITMGTLLSTWMPLSLGVVISILYRIVHTVVEILWSIFGDHLPA